MARATRLGDRAARRLIRADAVDYLFPSERLSKRPRCVDHAQAGGQSHGGWVGAHVARRAGLSTWKGGSRRVAVTDLHLPRQMEIDLGFPAGRRRSAGRPMETPWNGGDPAAASATATLLRLRPGRESHLRRRVPPPRDARLDDGSRRRALPHGQAAGRAATLSRWLTQPAPVRVEAALDCESARGIEA